MVKSPARVLGGHMRGARVDSAFGLIVALAFDGGGLRLFKRWARRCSSMEAPGLGLGFMRLAYEQVRSTSHTCQPTVVVSLTVPWAVWAVKVTGGTGQAPPSKYGLYWQRKLFAAKLRHN